MKPDGENKSAVFAPESVSPNGKSAAIPHTSATADMGGAFATGHLLNRLKGRTVSAAMVTTFAQGVQFILNLGSIMILARMLSPRDFGLVAMVGTVMSFLRIFNDAGLSTATVQREGITHAQVSNLFWTNAGLGALITLALMVGAPAVAWFYREPRLIGLTVALSCTFLFTASSVQHLALLKRQMRFKMIALVQIASATIGTGVGVGMAWLNFGYWSLAGMQLTIPLVTLIMIWGVSRWRPQLPSRRTGTRSLLGFGANLSASSFIWSFARGSDSLLIGRMYGSAALGLYSRAYALLIRPVEQFVTPIDAVLVPTLSRLQSDPERYRRVFLQAYDVVAIFSFLFSGLLFALPRPLTLVVLGPKWEETVPIFAGFTLVALYSAVTSAAGWLLTSQGRGGDFLKMTTICSAVAVSAFLLGLPYGPSGVAIAYSLSCLLVYLPLGYYFAGRSGPVSTRDLWSRFFTHIPVWGVVCGATWVTRMFAIRQVPLVQLLICVPVGIMTGIVFVALYSPSRRASMSLIAALQDWRKPSSA
jgi:O-antigen/teichoic acid export membrane protein